MGARTQVNWRERGWVEKLDRWWNIDGVSATKIGARFGVSRGAVLGKVHRMGWSGQKDGGKGGKNGLGQANRRRPPNLEEFKARYKRPVAKWLGITAWRSSPGTDGPKIGTYATSIRVMMSDPSEGERKTFADLGSHECSWPFEDRTFCARPSAKGCGHYCSAHFAQAHRPTPMPIQVLE